MADTTAAKNDRAAREDEAQAAAHARQAGQHEIEAAAAAKNAAEHEREAERALDLTKAHEQDAERLLVQMQVAAQDSSRSTDSLAAVTGGPLSHFRHPPGLPARDREASRVQSPTCAISKRALTYD